MQLRKCNYCSARIGFAETLAGKRVPLDMSAPVYEVVERDGKTVAVQLNAKDKQARLDGMRELKVGVSHWSTCPGAKQAAADRNARRSS